MMGEDTYDDEEDIYYEQDYEYYREDDVPSYDEEMEVEEEDLDEMLGGDDHDMRPHGEEDVEDEESMPFPKEGDMDDVDMDDMPAPEDGEFEGEEGRPEPKGDGN